MKDLSLCEPVYERLDGWKEPLDKVKTFEDLPQNAKRYINRLEELVGVPIGMISTGPERSKTIILQNPYVT